MLNHWGHTPGHLLILLYFHFQGRNLTWGRPVRKSRPQRSPLPSCSSRPSGRWRTSSMSLHWSSSSSSEHTPSERRTGSCTCWRKTSSTRRSTPKTSEWEWSVLAQREKRRYDWGDGGIEDRKQSCLTIWLWRSNQPGEATALYRWLLFSPAALPPPQLPFASISKVFYTEQTNKSRQTVPTACEGAHSCTQIQKDSFYFLVGSVLFVFDCILTLYYCCLFVCRDGDIFPQWNIISHASPLLLT